MADANNSLPLSFTANFTNVQPGGSYTEMPHIVFQGKVDDITVAPHSSEAGAFVATLTVSVVSPPEYAGAVRRRVIRVVDATEKGQNSRATWRAALESVGYQPSQLDSGNPITITADNFKGKACWCEHKPKASTYRDEKGVERARDDIEFLTPAIAKQKQAGLAAAIGNAPRQAATVTGPGATGTGGGQTPPGPNGAGAPLSPDNIKASLLL